MSDKRLDTVPSVKDNSITIPVWLAKQIGKYLSDNHDIMTTFVYDSDEAAYLEFLAYAMTYPRQEKTDAS